MWSRDSSAGCGLAIRLAIAAGIAALAAACFQPLYGERAGPGSGIRSALASVDVEQIVAPKGTPEAQIAVELRNELLFALTGGGSGVAPTHRLKIRMNVSKSAIIVDINTGRTEAEITGIDAFFTLTELATNKVVINSSTFVRVSSDVPGLQQRFARIRAQREAEERAAKVIADQIRSRLASHFVAGT